MPLQPSTGRSSNRKYGSFVWEQYASNPPRHTTALATVAAKMNRALKLPDATRYPRAALTKLTPIATRGSTTAGMSMFRLPADYGTEGWPVGRANQPSEGAA